MTASRTSQLRETFLAGAEGRGNQLFLDTAYSHLKTNETNFLPSCV